VAPAKRRSERASARKEGEAWCEATAEGLEAELDLSAVEVTLPLAEIYEDIEFDPIDEEA